MGWRADAPSDVDDVPVVYTNKPSEQVGKCDQQLRQSDVDAEPRPELGVRVSNLSPVPKSKLLSPVRFSVGVAGCLSGRACVGGPGCDLVAVAGKYSGVWCKKCVRCLKSDDETLTWRSL